MELFITVALIVLLFVLRGSGVWIGLPLTGVAWIGMELFTSRPVGDSMAVTIWGASSSWTLTALPLFGGRRCRMLMLAPKRRDLEELARLVEEGTLRPVIGEVFPLDAIREAHVRMQSGHVRGKIVVRP